MPAAEARGRSALAAVLTRRETRTAVFRTASITLRAPIAATMNVAMEKPQETNWKATSRCRDGRSWPAAVNFAAVLASENREQCHDHFPKLAQEDQWAQVPLPPAWHYTVTVRRGAWRASPDA